MKGVLKIAYSGIPNVTVPIVQNVELWTVCTPLSVNIFVTIATPKIWNIIVELFLKDSVYGYERCR
jgi:hypothetical protein